MRLIHKGDLDIKWTCNFFDSIYDLMIESLWSVLSFPNLKQIFPNSFPHPSDFSTAVNLSVESIPRGPWPRFSNHWRNWLSYRAVSMAVDDAVTRRFSRASQKENWIRSSRRDCCQTKSRLRLYRALLDSLANIFNSFSASAIFITSFLSFAFPSSLSFHCAVTQKLKSEIFPHDMNNWWLQTTCELLSLLFSRVGIS